MKRSLLATVLIAVTLFVNSLFGQENKPSLLELFSIEGGSGYHVPFLPNKDISTADYAGFNSFYVATKYAITDVWGVRIAYSSNTFKDKNDKSDKFTIQKMVSEVTFDILESLQTPQNRFGVVAHSGVGVSRGKGVHLADLDTMLCFQIGLMPLYRITNKFSVHLDGTYVLNLFQNQGYDGHYVYDDISDVTVSYLLLNMGVGVSFDF